MKRTNFVLVSVMMALASVVISGCNKNQKLEKVTMTYVKSPLNVPSIVEKAQQSFEAAFGEMGLKVDYSNLDSGADQTAALASGDIQILNAVGGTSIILSASNGADIKIIGMYAASPSAFQLFSKDESIKTPADLKGKTIAGPKGTNLHELIVSYLKTGDMTLDDVNFVSMGIPNAFAALENGSIDCALVAGPVAYNCKKAGYHLVTTGENLISGSILTATTQKFYDENKEIIKTFLNVQNETLKFINEYHAEAMAMAAVETGLSLEALEEMYPLYDFRSEITAKDIAELQATEKFMLESGLIENDVVCKDLLLKM